MDFTGLVFWVSWDCCLLDLSHPQSPTPFSFLQSSLTYSYTSVKIMVSSCRLVTTSYYIPYTSAICLCSVSYTGLPSVRVHFFSSNWVSCHDQWTQAMCSLKHDCWCDLLSLYISYFSHAVHTDSRQAHLVTHKSTRSDSGLCVCTCSSIFSNVLHVLRCMNYWSSQLYAVVDCKSKHRASAGSFVYSYTWCGCTKWNTWSSRGALQTLVQEEAHPLAT